MNKGVMYLSLVEHTDNSGLTHQFVSDSPPSPDIGGYKTRVTYALVFNKEGDLTKVKIRKGKENHWSKTVLVEEKK